MTKRTHYYKQGKPLLNTITLFPAIINAGLHSYSKEQHNLRELRDPIGLARHACALQLTSRPTIMTALTTD